MMYKYRSNTIHVATPHVSMQHLSKHISFCLLTATSSVFANPVGGSVAQGTATIDYGTTTIVTQQTNKAIVNWQDFSIKQGETTQFVQPSSSAVILNRVTGANASQIMGNLKANGQVFLVNPNGIVFGKTAQVNVAGLVASTAHITDADFMSGTYHFTNAPADSKIMNMGHITVQDTGLVALVAPEVVNQGVIQANLGKVILASGTDVTIDLYGDNLISFDAGSVVNNGLIEQAGTIEAQGGTVMLTAASAENLVESVVNMDGYINASSVSTHQGKVILAGGDNSTIQISGNIDASGRGAGQTGGTIEATAHYVELLAGSNLDVSGDVGGGNVLIGSDVFHNPADNPLISVMGTPSILPTADYVYAAPGSIVTADSLNAGNAGNVIAWGNDATWYYGSISAQAKGASGDGGRIETSGHYLDINGIQINTRSLSGDMGIWLLDPSNVTISNSVDSGSYTWTGSNPDTFTPTSDSNINTTTLYDTANASNVLITTGTGGSAGDVTFVDNLLLDSTHTFSVIAANNINFTTGSISITDGATVNLRADAANTGVGTVSFTGGTIFSSGPLATINIYYNPTSFAFPTNYSPYVLGGTLTPYMLVHDTVAGHTLSDISSNTAGDYALSENLSTGLGAFTPISAFSGKFTGSIMGTQYTISGLTINLPAATGVGLFGTVNGATLNDITLGSVNITGNSRVGAIAGDVTSAILTGTFAVTGGSVTGTGASPFDTAGLFGRISSTTSSANMSNAASVSGATQAAGIVGTLQTGSTLSGTLTDTGSITGTVFNVGGIAGYVNNSIISGDMIVGGASPMTIGSTSGSGQGYAYVIGNVGGSSADITSANITVASNVSFSLPGNLAVGGIIGGFGQNAHFSGEATGNYVIPAVYAPNSQYVGSVIGGIYDGGIAENLHSLANVTGAGNVGGVIGGILYFPGFVPTPLAFNVSANLTNTNTVTSTGSNAGGLIGSVSNSQVGGSVNFTGTLTNSGSVTGAASTAGLIGSVNNSTFVSNNMQSGSSTISGSSQVGGLFGNFTNSSISGTGYMRTTSGSIVIGSSTEVGGLIGLFGSGASLTRTGTTNMYTTGSVTGSGGKVGGAFGHITSDINDAGQLLTNNATVTDLAGGTSVDGGIIGWAQANTTMDFTNSATATVYAPNGTNIGGIVGDGGSHTGTLTNNASVTGQTNVGGIMGDTDGGSLSGTFTNTGTISGNTRVGGIAGLFFVGSMNGTYINSGNVNNTGNDTGGIVGYSQQGQYNGTFELTGGTVSGNSNVGGIIGHPQFQNTINSSATFEATGGTVTGSGSNIGGIVGYVDSGFGTNTWNITNEIISNVNVSGGGTNIGGIFGALQYSISAPLLSTGNVTGGSNVGGIVGTSSGNITQAAVPTGTITGNSQVGGIAGSNSATIQDALFGGTLATSGGSPTQFGGIVGSNTGTIINTLAVGTYNTSAATQVGALIGNNTGTITTSYFDSRDFATDVGSGTGGGVSYSTNAEFLTQSNYIGFNFPTVWSLDASTYYAYLTFCSTDCKVALPVPPAPPTPTPSIPNNIVQGIIMTNANNQATTTNNIIPGTSFVINLNVDNVGALFANLIDSLGVSTSVLDNVTFLQTTTQASNMTEEETQAQSAADFKTVVQALSNYYCGKSGG